MRYDIRVEEARSIKRRSRRDQVRLMLLIKEADLAGKLEEFADDIDITMAVTGNYLAAYKGYVELTLLPKTFRDADDVKLNEAIYELWSEVYDPVLDGRFGYGKVDNEGVEAAADELGLQGTSKAKDIAKNPRSMTAAILGDERASNAALDALQTLSLRSPEFRRKAQALGMYFVDPEKSTIEPSERPHLSFWARRIITLNDVTRSTRERAFNDDEAPEGLYDACVEGSDDLLATAALIKGRRQMNEVI